MEKLIVEIGMKLNKDFKFYDNLLKEHGLNQVFSCVTRDVYYSKEKSFEGFSEKQIKDNCIRIRNAKTSDLEKKRDLIANGYVKVFNTCKKDYHYAKESMNSRVQLQIVDDIGLIVYYDNPKYYNLPLETQRRLLLNELNSYGFNFNEKDLGIDKLRTLYYGKEMYSLNQNA